MRGARKNEGKNHGPAMAPKEARSPDFWEDKPLFSQQTKRWIKGRI